MKYDCVIIGGGPAGLSAALVLGRARKKVAVIDEGKPRNRVTGEMHGFLTRDPIAPSEFRRIAREQILAYPTVSFVADTAVSIAGTDGDFRITTAGGESYRSRKLLFAAGMKDLPLTIEGLADVYGKSAFVCPYCDGWEHRDQPLVVISSGADALHMAKLIAGWTNRFTICTNGSGDMTEAHREELSQRGIPVFDAPIRSVDSEGGIVHQVVLTDGTTVPCTGIFFRTTLVPGSDLPRAIGCEIAEAGTVVVDPFGKTNVPGVFSAGDAATRMHQAIAAASLGSMAAAAINGELSEEAWSHFTQAPH
ncbi:NAD(P)/FAD-dependent oxidoreductase [Paenibacillus sacheonensis]|nr:NAD(P)/FAD-dependent oxidoreductase [Paenibacillus sacheonensis]MBM7566616.1 thioredoxin reductase [Paenibacillus sacheonensis]